MTNTPWKRRELPRQIKDADAVPRLASAPAPLFRGPWKAAHRGADSTPAARRVLVCQHTGGSDTWLVTGNSPTLSPQNYPEYEVWREVSKSRHALAPGCQLEVHLIALRSGLSVFNGTAGDPPATGWHSAGAGGRVRITVDYKNLDAQTATATVEIEIPPSFEAYGAIPKDAGGVAWSYLIFRHVALLGPEEIFADDPEERAKWSENTTIWVTIEHRDGARVIQCAVQEVPHEHVVAHDEDTEVSIHGWPLSLPGPDRPQTDADDGATYEEHRFGTTRGMVAAARQAERLGPILASWTSYAESLAEVGDTVQDPIQITSTSFVGLSVGSSVTSWSADAPGWPIVCYSPPAPENLSTRLDGAASIPVRIWAEVRWTAGGPNTGVIRFQTSARSWVELELSQSVIGSTWTEVEVSGWLEAAVAPDDAAVLGVDLAKVTGGTLEARNWAISYGEHAMAR